MAGAIRQVRQAGARWQVLFGSVSCNEAECKLAVPMADMCILAGAKGSIRGRWLPLQGVDTASRGGYSASDSRLRVGA